MAFTNVRWLALTCSPCSLLKDCRVPRQQQLVHPLLVSSEDQLAACISAHRLHHLRGKEAIFMQTWFRLRRLLTNGEEGRRNGSLSGFIIRRPSSSAAAQCQALTEDPSIPMTAWTARFSLDRFFGNKLELTSWAVKPVQNGKERRNSDEIVSHVILIKDGFDELKIRRSSSGARLTIVSRALVMSSSSSVEVNKLNDRIKCIIRIWAGVCNILQLYYVKEVN